MANLNENEDNELRKNVILSANRAMLGAITPELRAITVDYNKEWLTLRAYFDQGASEDNKELIDVCLAEMAADLWQDIKQFRFEPIDLYYPIKMDNLKDWIYRRHETDPSPI